MGDEQGGEISFYKKNAAQIADNLRALRAECCKRAAQIEAVSAEYVAAKKQTIAMQKQYKEYKAKDAQIKEQYASRIAEIIRDFFGG